MDRTTVLLRGVALACACATVGSTAPARAEGDPDAKEIRALMEALREENAEMRRQLDRMQDQLTAAREDAREARDVAHEASARAELPDVAAGDGAGLGDYPSQAVWQRRMGSATVQLLDVSMDVLAAAGWSNADDDELLFLQGGGHDPNQRGFTLQQAELSLIGVTLITSLARVPTTYALPNLALMSACSTPTIHTGPRPGCSTVW